MFSSPALLVVLTAVFAGTGLYSLVRLSALASGAATGGDRVAELSHLLMSVAMLGMTWGRTGGPDTPGGVVQLVVFGLLSAWFLVHVLRPYGHRRVGAAYHAVVQVAMVWMVAAMPALMGMGGAAAGSAVHHRDGHAAGGDTAAMAGPATATGPRCGCGWSPSPSWCCSAGRRWPGRAWPSAPPEPAWTRAATS
ncbi:hypothetical protein GCM10023320_13970 [Pseudonocardia adelaidensis]|uniref:DUF5134 domain-containing protein n=1 Tax=Pseudonocardia adelaidensis TaxID=648754 RepID=A0ABP9NDL0_9PSEU